MVFDVKVEVSSDLKKLLDSKEKKVDMALKKACDDLGYKINNKIKESGFAPRDTGKLAESHHVVSNDKETLIKSNRLASNGVPLWIYITDGHKTRRRKDGKRGYVEPNVYHRRAVNAVSMDSVLSIIKSELLK